MTESSREKAKILTWIEEREREAWIKGSDVGWKNGWNACLDECLKLETYYRTRELMEKLRK